MASRLKPELNMLFRISILVEFNDLVGKYEQSSFQVGEEYIVFVLY